MTDPELITQLAEALKPFSEIEVYASLAQPTVFREISVADVLRAKHALSQLGKAAA